MIPAIYDTAIAHTRTAPIRHSFRYRSQSWYVDIDDLPRPPWWLRPLVGFRASDHLRAPATGPDTLHTRVDEALRSEGVEPRCGRVTALLNSRCLGYVFDPVTIFWCHGPGGDVYAAIVEVHNTYGGRRAYVVEPNEAGRAVFVKDFYVSPFNPVDGRYRLRLPEPAERLQLDIILDISGENRVVATPRGVRRRVNVAMIVRSQIRAPLVPLVVMARIRFQGIRLWRRGLPVTPRNSVSASQILQESS